MYRLRLTRRALEDVQLDVPTHCELNADEYAKKNAAVAKFVSMRRQSPVGQESTDLPSTKATVWNLHSDRFRGLTWHDVGSEVVWLLGIEWHETGSRVDAYKVLKQRDADGFLFPIEQDYLDLEPEDAEWFFEAALETARPLISEAQASSGAEVRREIADCVIVAYLVRPVEIEEQKFEEVWVGIAMPPNPPNGLSLPDEWMAVLLAALLPDAPFEELKWDRAFPRDIGSPAHEIVVYWSSI